jgi:deazaflavin-dependent oxidoreductase (nitroreductase family)
MDLAPAPPDALRRLIHRLGASPPGAWLFARVLDHLDRPVHRLTRGRHTLTSLLAGVPIVMLTTTGARSGQARTSPLVGFGTDAGIAVIASNFGQRHHPAWSYNLRAHPEAVMTLFGRDLRVRASVVDGERRAAIWEQAVRIYPGYAQYARRAAHRDIVVWELQPIPG